MQCRIITILQGHWSVLRRRVTNHPQTKVVTEIFLISSQVIEYFVHQIWKQMHIVEDGPVAFIDAFANKSVNAPILSKKTKMLTMY